MLLRCVSSERLRIPVKLAFTPLQGVCIFFNGVKIVWRASAFNVGHHCSFTLSHRAAWRKRKWCCDGRKSALLCSCGFVLPSHCFFFTLMLSPSLSFILTFTHFFMTATMRFASVNYFLSWTAALLLSPFLSNTFINASSFIHIIRSYLNVTYRSLWKHQHQGSAVLMNVHVVFFFFWFKCLQCHFV